MRLPDSEIRMMQTALGGAGLAVAFNAPIGGTLFTLEEVTRSFGSRPCWPRCSPRRWPSGVPRLVLGDHAEFQMEGIAEPELVWLPLFVVFGVLTGGLGALYNRLVLLFLDHVTAAHRVSGATKAALIGAVIGLVMVIYPRAVGGGELLTQMILGGERLVLSVVVGYLMLRFLAGPLSIPRRSSAACCADAGGRRAVGRAVRRRRQSGLAGDIGFLTVPMAVVGMAAFFGASVRAPVTGMVLVLEMTASTAAGSWPQPPPAVLTAYLVGSPPIWTTACMSAACPRPEASGP